MISQKFSIISDDMIADFMSDRSKGNDNVLQSVESVSDLWVLANIKETYDKVDC